MRRSRRRATVLGLRLALIVTLLAVWETGSGRLVPGVKFIDPLLFSSPSAILLDLAKVTLSGQILADLFITLQEAFYGLVLGIVTGLLVGLLFAYSPLTGRVLDPLLVAVNAVPRPALAPIFVIWLGLGMPSKVLLAWSVVFFVVFYNTYQGILSVDPDMIKAIRVTGASAAQITRIVILPAVFSWIFAALRTSVGFALIGAVVGEFVGATGGLGYRMIIAEGLLQTERLYSILVILMIVGVTLTGLAKRVEDRVLRWRPTTSL